MSRVSRRQRKRFNWFLPSVNAHLFSSAGWPSANVLDGILAVPRCTTPVADVSSGIEISRGIKSAEKMTEFTAAVALPTQFQKRRGQPGCMTAAVSRLFLPPIIKPM
jgi:phosphoribosylanthranilate isomerase